MLIRHEGDKEKQFVLRVSRVSKRRSMGDSSGALVYKLQVHYPGDVLTLSAFVQSTFTTAVVRCVPFGRITADAQRFPIRHLLYISQIFAYFDAADYIQK